MTAQLVFNNTPLSIITLNNQIWITSSELAKALNYSDQSSVNRIYSRYQYEFTNNSEITSIENLTDDELINSVKPYHKLDSIDIVGQK